MKKPQVNPHTHVFWREKLEETNNSIVYWESRIEKYEEAHVIVGTAACKDCLNTAIENKKYFENEIKENEALIKELRKED